MGTSTISMTMFNSYVTNYQRVQLELLTTCDSLMILQVPANNKPDFGLLHSSNIPQKSYFPAGSLEICNFGPFSTSKNGSTVLQQLSSVYGYSLVHPSTIRCVIGFFAIGRYQMQDHIIYVAKLGFSLGIYIYVYIPRLEIKVQNIIFTIQVAILGVYFISWQSHVVPLTIHVCVVLGTEPTVFSADLNRKKETCATLTALTPSGCIH